MDDYEKVFEIPPKEPGAVLANVISRSKPYEAKESPLTVINENMQRNSFTPVKRRIDPGGVKLSLVHLPAGQFVMGDVNGESNEYPGLYFVEMNTFVDLGYTPMEAIVCATKNGAIILGEEDKLGMKLSDPTVGADSFVGQTATILP